MEIIVNKLKFKDLFSLAKIIKKLDITNGKLPEDFSNQSYQQMCLIAFDLVLEGLEDIEQDLYKFIADVSNITIEQAPELEIEQLQEFLRKFFEKNDIQQVFTQAKNMLK